MGVRLAIFDMGTGPRLGVVRRNHLVDAVRLVPGILADRQAVDALDTDRKRQLAALALSCPLKDALQRRDAVRVLDEWDAELA